MAILFSEHCNNSLYQIRTAGRTTRLYTNGVFHSQWNPARPLGGAVWDLLSLPVLYLPRRAGLRVLVLGVGGGAVLRQLQQLLERPQMTGVELDPMHLRLAEQFFALDSSVVQLHCADAVQWLEDYRGEPFDYIIDDLFSHHEGEAARAFAVDRRWARALWRVSRSGGAITINFACPAELRQCALMKRSLGSVMQWSQPGYDNAVGVFLRGAEGPRQWRAALRQHPQLSAAQQRVALACKRRRLL